MLNTNKNSMPIDSDSVDISRIIRVLLMQSKLILGIVFIVTSLSVALYINTEKLYKVKSLLQVLPSEQMGFTPSPARFLLGENSSTTDIDSIKQLYESRSNVISIIKDLELDNEDSIDKSYNKFVAALDIDTPLGTSYSRFFNDGAMLEISFITNDIERGLEILNYSNNYFIKKIIENESEQAELALEFISQRSDEIKQQLSEKKSKLKNFRTENQTIDVDLEIQSIIASLDQLDKNLNNIDLEIEKAKNNYTETNPIFLNLLNQRDTLVAQRAIISNKIQDLPLSQQQFIDLYKDVEITQEVFNELENRKLEFSLKKASTLGNMRVIDEAYLEGKVSPTLSMIVISFLISSFMAIILAIFRGLYLVPISNPAELEDHKIFIPVLGVLAKHEKEELKDDEKFNQSVESLVVNIQNKLVQKDEGSKQNIVVFSSPTSANGKSFISRNFSLKLAKTNKKVLLIDADYKRGDQHKSFDGKKITKDLFFSINETNIDSLKDGNSGLYVIPKIMKMRSSFDFLYDPRLSEKIEWFKEFFDYVVIDTAPILSVSDTLVLLSYADASILVTRHGVNKVNEIKQSVALFEQIGLEPDGIVYNCYERPSSYYGYYGLYGNYSYQYYANRYLYQNYDYESEKD